MSRLTTSRSIILLCLLVLSGGPVLLAQGNLGGGPPVTETDAEAVSKWLASQAIVLKSIDAGHGFEDLKPLKRVLRDVHIVGLGEDTHGTREFFQFKHRMVEFLVKEAGFTVLAMEVSYPAAFDINNYVLNGTGNRNEVLARQGLWAWDTQEVSELIEWMRQYNSSVPAEKKVRFLGFDMHNNEQAIDVVSAYLEKVAPERLESFKIATQRLRSNGSGRQHLDYTAQVSAADKAQTLAALNELLGFCYLNQARFTLQTSAAEFERAVEHARILAQFADTYRRPRFDAVRPTNSSGYARDLYLAENIQRIINSEKPGTRIILWAHNEHIGKYKGVMGDFLRLAYGSDYYALGFSFNQGAFQARELSRNVTIGALTEFKVGSAPEGFVEWYLNRTGIKNFIIDLRHPPKDEAIERWLMRPHPMRSIGLGYSYSSASLLPVDLRETFDGLVFIETTTRARPNPTGMRGAWIIPEKGKG